MKILSIIAKVLTARPLLLSVIALAGFSAALLFHIKYEVLAIEKSLSSVRDKISATTEDITTLRAEWAYLSHPKRVKELSTKYLSAQPMERAQVMAVDPVPAQASTSAASSSK